MKKVRRHRNLSMKETFAPSVLLPPCGETYTPRGWEWVLAFALRGVPWAVEQADTEEFREIIRKDLRRRYMKRLEDEIAHYEKRIDKLKEKLRGCNEE